VECRQIHVGCDRNTDEVADGNERVHRSVAVDFTRCRQYRDGRQKGRLDRQCHRDVVHVTAAHQELLGGGLESITVSDDETEEHGEQQEESEHEVVCPVERWDVVGRHHCPSVPESQCR